MSDSACVNGRVRMTLVEAAQYLVGVAPEAEEYLGEPALKWLGSDLDEVVAYVNFHTNYALVPFEVLEDIAWWNR